MVTTTATTTTTRVRSPIRTWLTALGIVLVLLAILGLVQAAIDFFHGIQSHIEAGEMVLHWVLAIATLGLAFAYKDEVGLANLGIAYGAVYVLVGLVGFFMPDIGAWHVGLTDNILHIALGVVTIAAAMASRRPNLAARGYETEVREERIGMSRRR